MKYFGTVNNKDYGFYLSKDDLLSYKIVSDEIWENCINQANKENKTISCDEDGNPILVNRVIGEEEKKNQELDSLYSYLKDTDYVSIKIAEGAATKEDYATILEKRAEARKRINELEKL